MSTPLDSVRELIESGPLAHLVTVNHDGSPQVTIVWVGIEEDEVVSGHLYRHRKVQNIERDPRVCIEIDEHEGVFDYGQFECDSGLAYRSICLFGRIRVVGDTGIKQRFCETLMAKYGKPDTIRPKGFFPRIDGITVYAIAVERMTGKEMALPQLSEQWPAKDRTKTPNARP